jgi:hypothetical protein
MFIDSDYARMHAHHTLLLRPSDQHSLDNQSTNTPMHFPTSQRKDSGLGLVQEESLAGMLARIVVRWYELGLRSARGCELRSLGLWMTACPCTSALSRTKPHPLGIWFVKGDRHAESSTAIEESRLRCQKSHGLRSAGWCGHPCHHTLPCLLEGLTRDVIGMLDCRLSRAGKQGWLVCALESLM